MGLTHALIEAQGLAIGYHDRPLADGIDLTVNPGEVLVLLGPNGAGKTTLLRTVLGLLPPIAGSITLLGQDLSRLSRSAIARTVAMVPQSLAPPFSFTARDVVLMARTARLGPFASPGPTDERVVEDALARLGIPHLAQRAVTELSGGQRQLVLIARALAQQAPALILDEPTASLDWGNRLRLLDVLERLAADGLGMILSTHEPDHATRLATTVMTIDAQGNVWQGSPAEALDLRRLAALYGLDPAQIDRRHQDRNQSISVARVPSSGTYP